MFLSSWWWAACHSKHVEQLRNIGIINSTARSHLVGYFYKTYESRTFPWTAGLTGYLHCTTLPNFGQIRQVESRVWSTASPSSATFRASDLTVHLGTHPTVHDCSLLTSGTAWYSRFTRFVGACWLHLQGEENYSKFMLKFWPWGRQNLYSKFAQPVAGRQHVVRDTVSCCPLRHLKWDETPHPLPWQSRDGTPAQFWELWDV